MKLSDAKIQLSELESLRDSDQQIISEQDRAHRAALKQVGLPLCLYAPVLVAWSRAWSVDVMVCLTL